MAAKKRKVNNEEDESEDVVEHEVEVESEPEESGPKSASDSGDSATTYEMGKIYIAGVDDEEEEGDGPVNVDEYEEMDDSPDLKKARDLISGTGNDDDTGNSTAEEDPFLENVDYDPSEEWVLGD